MLSLKQGLSEEDSLKEKLQERIEFLTDEIDYLKDEIVDYRETEKSYITALQQLQADKEELSEKVDNDIEIDQEEYQKLTDQLNIYQDQVEELKKELAVVKDNDALFKSEQVRQIHLKEKKNGKIKIKKIESLLLI